MGYAKLAVLISRNWCGGGRCRFGGSLVPLAPLPLTLCEGRIGCAGGVGDYQIAPIAVQSTAMGRWRLTPPGYGGTCLPAGRSVRGSDRPPACHSIPRTPQGEGFFRLGALLLALFISFCLFISFWRCRSGRSETGATGRRRGLRRGRRSWGSPWHRRPWYRWWGGSSNSRRRREPPPTWP